ncbi:TPA: energy-coupling factor ABC transporter permease [Neisseria meningitidis]
MIFQTVWFSDMVLSVSWIVLILILAASAPSAFRSLARYRSALPLCTVIFSAAWCLNASASGGQLAQMNYHLLAVNLVALMVGTSAAFWLAALLMLPYCLLFADSAGAYPPNALVLILPALVVNRLSRMLVNRLPPNIFIFIFVNGFLASAAGILLTGLVLTGILDAANAFPSEILWTTALPVFILLAWAEAFLSGISTAIFVALKPHWINTFDDNRYLKSDRGIWR